MGLANWNVNTYVHGVEGVKLKLHTPESLIRGSLRNQKNFVGEPLAGSLGRGRAPPLRFFGWRQSSTPTQ